MGRRGPRGPGKGNRNSQRGNWTEVTRENKAWEDYYRAQGLIAEDEWPQFKAACQEALPSTFRITKSRVQADEIRDSIKSDFVPSLINVTYEGNPVPPPQPIAFYPDEMAWEIKVGKGTIRKQKEFARLQRFLVVETESGNVSRQEAVSMIPPLLLDVEPHHNVIDLCAAPGSKTAQLIEDLHANGADPTGIIFANDSDYKRAHLLTHQVKRLNSPNLIVTNHDARHFPRVLVNNTGKNRYLKFDRVLCDVPCSGDGTMRKNVNVWKDWSNSNALGLHSTQVDILMRGVHLLRNGGRLVFSTCSLNPIENEAIVAEALRQSAAIANLDLRLVDVSDRLPQLVRTPGVSTWRVQNKAKKWLEEPDEQLGRSYFPPSAEETAQFGLEKCMRLYPHQQDTGGFFVAVFEKGGTEELDEVPITNKRPAEAVVENEGPNKSVKTDDGKVRLPRDANEEPFKFLSPSNEVLESCWQFYGIDRTKFPPNSLLVRNATGEPIRTIYYVTPTLRPVIEFNEARLKFVHAGIKMFAQQKNEGACKWRVQSEGLEFVYPHASLRVVRASSIESLKELCAQMFPRFDRLKEFDEQLHDQILQIEEGCAFLEVLRDGQKLVYPLWRGKSSVNVMLPKQDVQELLHRVFGIENVKQKGGQAVEQTETESGKDTTGIDEDTADGEAEASEVGLD